MVALFKHKIRIVAFVKKNLQMNAKCWVQLLSKCIPNNCSQKFPYSIKAIFFLFIFLLFQAHLDTMDNLSSCSCGQLCTDGYNWSCTECMLLKTWVIFIVIWVNLNLDCHPGELCSVDPKVGEKLACNPYNAFLH